MKREHRIAIISFRQNSDFSQSTGSRVVDVGVGWMAVSVWRSFPRRAFWCLRVWCFCAFVCALDLSIFVCSIFYRQWFRNFPLFCSSEERGQVKNTVFFSSFCEGKLNFACVNFSAQSVRHFDRLERMHSTLSSEIFYKFAESSNVLFLTSESGEFQKLNKQSLSLARIFSAGFLKTSTLFTYIICQNLVDVGMHWWIPNC